MSSRFVIATIASCLIGAAPAAAEDARPAAPGAKESGGTIRLELNRLAPGDGDSCVFTFVAGNGLGADLDRLAYQTVMFDGEGLVDRMTVFDFGKVQAGRTVVRQFALSRLGCEGVSRVLVNDAPQCAGDGIAPETCIDRLETANRTDRLFGR